jgi:hypothetical protein
MTGISTLERVAMPPAGAGFDPVDAIERAPLQQEPFDHIYMQHVFAPDAYRRMLEQLPETRRFRELSHRDAMREDGTSTRLRLYLYPELLLRLPAEQRAVWLPIARALRSPALELALKRKFRAAIETRFGRPAETIGLYPVPILLRDQPGYRIGIHADIPSKVITVQFYLPRDASQRHIGTIFHEGQSGEAAARTQAMPFLPATGYAFVVTDRKSWHSAARTAPADGERVTMMVTYYLADDLRARLKRQGQRLLMSLGHQPEG